VQKEATQMATVQQIEANIQESDMSDQQIAANRLNAQRSTGPRTAAGKARVSSNALKHGLTGRDVVLPGENPDDFDSFRAGLLTSLDPQGELEGAFAERIVVDLWRLRRIPIVEAALYRRGCKELLVKQAAEAVKQYESTQNGILEEWDRKVVAASDQQAHKDAEQNLLRVRAELNDLTFNITRVLEMFPEQFSNLSRHEVALSRSMQRTLHELERLQARRAGEHVSAPEVVDVDVSLGEPPRHDIGESALNGETDGNQR
jgi:hypothetical protein